MTAITDSNQEMVTEIYIESDMLKITGSKVKIFALDVQTIGLSNNPPSEWVEDCLWSQEAEVLEDKGELTIILPTKVVRFYKPKKIELAGSVAQDNILLIVHQ